MLCTNSQPQNAVRKYVEYSYAEWIHQGPGNQLMNPSKAADSVPGRIKYRERRGGMCNYYHRRAS